MTDTVRDEHIMRVIAASPHYYELTCKSCDRFVVFTPELQPAFNVIRVGDLSALHATMPVERETGEDITVELTYLNEEADLGELLEDVDLDDLG